MLPSLHLLALTSAFALVKHVNARLVFAHYLAGTVTQAHAQKDIDDAKAAGIDGFALNIGDPTGSFLAQTLPFLFDYAESVGGFQLHISVDVSASGGQTAPFVPILSQYMGRSGYFKVNGVPFVTTFSDGGLTNTEWDDWKASLNQNIYFCPDFDATQGYTTGDPGWWAYWGDTVDCVLSWDAAWPIRPGTTAGSVSEGSIEIDLAVLAAAHSRGKQYNMPLSTLQYKDAYGANLYRSGDLTFPKRMENILGMTDLPDFVTILTWNDGPESHYVGNIWAEANTDADPARYVSAGSRWDHGGWRPLLTSFINAYKSGASAASMVATNSASVQGAMWYSSVIQASTCSPDTFPDNWQAGLDQLNWAVVVGASVTNFVVKVISDGVTQTFQGTGPGLHYGVAPKTPGQQSIEVFTGSTQIGLGQGGRCVSALCPDGIYNMNQIVVGIVPPGSAPPLVACD